jgi:glucokinase
MICLAADIGGTYSRLAWRTPQQAQGWVEQRFDNAGFADLEAVIARGRELLDGEAQAIECMVLALPGPVHEDPVQLTNIDWRVQRAALRRRFGVRELLIVNDFQAAALGAVGTAAESLRVLNPGQADAGPVVVAGAGTGLGMAWLAGRDDPALPRATEGGHLDFAPNDERQVALYRHLAARHGHVSYERILSGDGLLELYRWSAGASASAASPAEVAALAAADDACANEAVALFVQIFAAYAGNLALAFNPSGGIYLCGGLTAHLAERFSAETFAAAFSAKGRMRDLVRRIPVYLVTGGEVGLAGAMTILDKICKRADR